MEPLAAETWGYEGSVNGVRAEPIGEPSIVNLL
jgi:hypothetical protein